MLYIAERNLDKCGICGEIVTLYRYVGYFDGCVGWGAGYFVCPNQAIRMVES